MLWLIVGLVLLSMGAFFFFSQNDSKPGSTDTTASTTETQATEDPKKNDEEEQKKREEQLQKIVVPNSMPEIQIYFGSQTGTAEKLSNILAEEADSIGIKADVIDFNSFSEETFPKHKMVIVCVATHYEGDPCDNTRNFHKWFKKIMKSKDKPFSGMNFTIFGLGDTSYEQYNEMGKQFDEGFEKLGAKRLFDMGVGNAETFSTESDFAAWKEELWSTLAKHYAQFDSAQDKSIALQRKASLRTQDKNVLPWILADEGQLQEEPQYVMNMRNYLAGSDLAIIDMKELRQKPGALGDSSLEISFDLKGSGMTYKTAANFAIYATNTQEDVERFAKQHNLDLNRKFVFMPNEAYTGRAAKLPFPTGSGITIREALTKFIDLTGALTIKALETLIPMCESQEDKNL